MYDFDGDEELRKRFFESIDNGDVQTIGGRIRRTDGEIVLLNDKNLLDNVYIDSQCTFDENIFNFGEMYVGSAEITVKLPDENINLIKGGELRLYFGTETILNKWIPLGVWDIVSAEREYGNIFKIKAYDKLNRLNTPVNINLVGAVRIEFAMRQVEKIAGVKFSQSIEEIQQLAGDRFNVISGVWATHYLDTCWDEVRAIAQFLGCFAFANRDGEIEFRKFAVSPVLTIPPEKRFSAKISDYQYRVGGISYTDKSGYTSTYTIDNDEGTSYILGFSDNKYIAESKYNYEDVYLNYLKTVTSDIETIWNKYCKWSPGTVEYYGNPALDVGDMVQIADGVNHGNGDARFLITHISWQFRGSQTLISAGAPETGTAISSGSGGSSGTTVSYTSNNYVNNISVVEMKTYAGEVFGTERFVAKTGFSNVSETWVFAECTLILSGDGLVSASVWLDGIAQTLRPKITLHNGEISTFHFGFTTKISGGRHQMWIGVRGNAEIADIQAFLWGQDVTAETPEITGDSDYIYTTENGLTTVTGYTGKSVFPSIPDDLGSGQTVCIEKNSFTGSAVESVYIPDGVTEIR